MADVKVTKKDIQEARQPDAVLEGATSLFDWLLEHRNVVLGALIAVLVVVGGISVAQNVRQGKNADIGGKLSGALELTTRPVEAPKADDKKDENASKVESFASKAEKEKAVQDALTSVTKEHADSVSAKSASIVLAAQRLNEGKPDEAISLAESYAKSDEGALRAAAYETLGNAYLAKNDLSKAEDAYKKVGDAGAPAQSLMLQAGLQEKAGKKDDARKLYEKIIADEKDNANLAREARTRLDLLDLPPAGQGALEAPAAPAEQTTPAADKKAPKKAPTP